MIYGFKLLDLTALKIAFYHVILVAFIFSFKKHTSLVW